MNPYALIGGAVAVALVFGGGVYVGKRMERATCLEAKQAAEDGYLRKLSEIDAARDKAAQDAADAQAKLDQKIREKAKEVIRYVQSPAAAAVCLDADGMRVWNSDAETGPGEVRSQPDAARPGDADEARSRDGG